jgi:hypothetical protein
LLLLSPNRPWYFLPIVPFVALCGNAPTWAISIGALLLTNEMYWEFHLPKPAIKSILFGSLLVTCIWSVRAAYLKRAAGTERSQ